MHSENLKQKLTEKISNASVINVTIDAASIYTNDDARDGHLKSADFFDVENNKEITFKSTSFRKIDKENYKLAGLLNHKGYQQCSCT